jgi:hypothetical protein
MKRVLIFGLALIVLALGAFSQTTRNTSGKDKPDEQTQPPVVSINPSSIDFKDQVAKKASKPLRITVTNSGGKDLYINSVAIEGDNKDDFSMIRDTCTGATIPANKSCVIDIAMTPAAAERRVATLVITDNALDSPQRARLIGNGINSSAVRPGER